ncbi:MAG: glycoside hydrolase family 13 protein [Chloroflexota bacterium]
MLDQIASPSLAAARRLRPVGPFHLPPAAQPPCTWIELTVEDAPAQPDMVLRDIHRDFTWRVALTKTVDTTIWTARIMLPSVPTIIRYHFEFADGSTLLELRQLEGRNTPIYGEWKQQEFQIAVYDPAQMPAEWTQGTVIYQIFPDSFAKGDTSTDRVSKDVYGQAPVYKAWGDPPEAPPRGRDFYGGNLRGLIDKLDYLVDLGVETLYLTPIFESPTNHRYDALDYFKIDPMLGTEQDLVELVEKAHQRHLKIVLDAVFNHCSCDSRYFNAAGHYGSDTGAVQNRESPYYRWFEFKQWPKIYEGWIGLKHMPEFVECPEVEDFFIGAQGVTTYWLQRGIDGWRTDVTGWVSDEFWRRFHRSVKAINPAAYLVSEEWENASHYLVGDSFDATMNYRFAWALQGFLAVDKLTASELDDRLETWRRDTPAPALLAQMNLLDSHDTGRIMTFCQNHRDRFFQMVAFQLAYPGAPMIYYGDEAGLTGDYAEDGRKAFPWESVDVEISAFYKRALAARRTSKALQIGSVETLLIDDDRRLYVFVRRLDGESVYVAFNASDQAAAIQIPVGEAGQWRDALAQHPTIETQNRQLSFEIQARGAAWYCKV